MPPLQRNTYMNTASKDAHSGSAVIVHPRSAKEGCNRRYSNPQDFECCETPELSVFCISVTLLRSVIAAPIVDIVTFHVGWHQAAFIQQLSCVDFLKQLE